MIQSRPQFGHVGALLIWLFVYVQYFGFNIFNIFLARQALQTTVHGSDKLWFVVVTVAALVVALVGYDLIHRFERYLAYGFIAIFGVFTVGVLATLHFPAGSMNLSDFHWTPFLAQFGIVAGYQISWAPYVSDYSRYLPPDVTMRRTFQWTYWGSALGAIWLMCLGTVLAASIKTGDAFDVVKAINLAGDKVFSGFGAVVLTAQHADGRMLGADVAGTPEDALNTCLQNITGHPAVSLPAGTLPSGLPFGLLLTGPRFRDDLLLDLAARWEQARPWPWFAPGFEPLVPAP